MRGHDIRAGVGVEKQQIAEQRTFNAKMSVLKRFKDTDRETAGQKEL